MGFLDDRWVEAAKVVRTDQPERNLRINGQVQQGLIQLTFQNFLGTPASPNGLADTAYGSAVARMLINKLLPSWNDSRRITAQLGHIDEFHLARLRTQAFTQPVGMASHDCHHDRLA